MHLDICTDQLNPTVERLVTLGASRVQPDTIEEAGFRWIVMAGPQGNELCVCAEP
jgi:hypothetical protein